MTENEGVVQNPLRTPLRKAIRTALKRGEKKAAKLRDELIECEKAEFYLECGEILKANLHPVKRGMSSVELPDMYNSQQMRVIDLDEQLKPLDNARKYFKKQRKLNKGQEILEKQLANTEEVNSQIRDLLQKYLAWEDESEITLAPPVEFAERAGELRIHVAGLLQKKTQVSKRKAEPSGVRIFTSYDKLKVYVGKSARDNDNLSIRVARGNDWWFHVAGVQGSHVVVRLESKQQGLPLPQETLLDAATLAVYYSKARKATRADVHYTQAKNIRKAKKAPPGQVVLNNAKTINLRIEEDRLDRLLQRSI